MFREGGTKAEPADVSAGAPSVPKSPSFLVAPSFAEPVSSASVSALLPAWVRASHVTLPLLVAEIAAFALAAASGKIPSFLFTAIRALLTF